ncbi:unnamed protein product [Caenorhabditis sp. 36 PRJEB53466]|nr:unnamed protein product [Caenorhabditis sp. 36 PRJEB53466]
MHAEGGMSIVDLQELIDRRIPEHRNKLETSHEYLKSLANQCEQNYVIHSKNQSQILEQTKQAAIESVASVAWQIHSMTRDFLDMLELQTDKVNSLTNQVLYVSQVVDIHKEKLARREIGALTTNKTPYKQPKIIAPAVQEPKERYQRKPIDFSALDGLGHGVRTSDTSRAALISRAASSISGSSPSQFHNDSPAYGVYSGERTATLGRSIMRPYAPSIAPSDYRLPQVAPLQESRMTRQISHGSEFGEHMSGGGSGSHHGSSDYNHSYQSDRYGTIRAGGGRMMADGPRLSSAQSSTGGGESPTFPLPPPQLSTLHYNGYVAPGSVVQQQQQQLQMQQQQYGTIRKQSVNRHDLPPPPSSVLSGGPSNLAHPEDIDDLPPPPADLGGSSAYGVLGGGSSLTPTANLFDASSGWVPQGDYIEKARVLYDYDAEKEDELTLRENAVVYVVKKNEDGWYEGVLDGVTGLFPGNYVEKL